MSEFNVKAILRTDKKRKDGLCPIYLKISIKGKHLKLPSGIASLQEEWECRLGMYKEANSSVRNSVLKKKITSIESFLWKQLAADNPLNVKMVKDEFGRQKKHGFYLLLDDCYQVKFRTLAEGTKAHYLLVKKRLTEFNGHIRIGDLDIHFLIRFEKFLANKGVGVNGIATHHKILRVIINYGIKQKLIRENPYSDFTVKKGSPRMGTLTAEQIRTIQSLTITTGKKRLNKGLELTRDLFLFSCYTALRFGDVTKLTKRQIVGTSHLLLLQEKTGSVVQVPLLNKSLELINKYATSTRETLFPDIKNQTVNRYLKRIAAMCAIDVNVHFHLSRHSFGNIMASSGVNAFALSKVMGHRNIRTTMLYVNNHVESVKEQMARATIFD